MLKLTRELAQDGPAAESQLGITEQINEWLKTQVTSGLNEDDVRRYRLELTRGADACHWAGAHDATYDGLVKYFAVRRNQDFRGKDGGAPKVRRIRGKTYNAIVLIYQQFFAEAGKRGWLKNGQDGKPFNPMDGVGWANQFDSEEGSRDFTVDQVKAILAHVRTPSGDRRRNGERFYPYLLSASSPFRVSTIRRLMPEMFSWAVVDGHLRGQFTIARKAVKKSQRLHVVPLPEETTAAMIEWLETHPEIGPKDKMFPRIPEYETIVKDAAACGIPQFAPEGCIGWNSFRKFYLNEMATRVEPLVLCAISGHKDVKTLQKFYLRTQRLRAAANVAELVALTPTGARGRKSSRKRLTPTGARVDDDGVQAMTPTAHQSHPVLEVPFRGGGRRPEQSRSRSGGAPRGLDHAPDRASAAGRSLNDPDGIRTHVPTVKG